MSYAELLKKAKKELPEQKGEGARFEVPKVTGHIQGNKTIISNFIQIANTIRREPEHLLKYILKELAAPGEIKKSALIIGSKIPSNRINEKISSYVDNYVICKTCHKPDSKLSRDKGGLVLACQACGARQTVSNI
ncbi:translation initiation factor IF-2 subunit beta [Candidatus Woesearchaeota archaeon]|nr:translation initiation factor IF-2 subunit beta [Candidatus Woesearchaeota archaeon]